MSLPPAFPAFANEDKDRKRKSEIEDMMRFERPRYFRDEGVQQEYRNVITRLANLKEARNKGTATDFRKPGPLQSIAQSLPVSKPPTAAAASAPMSDRIFVTYDRTTVPDAYHSAIHYQRRDSSGKIIAHNVIEAKPEHSNLSSPMKVIGTVDEALNKSTKPSLFGNIQAEIRRGEPDEDNLPYETIAEEGDLSGSWQKIQDYVDEFNTNGYPYRGVKQNSNTFAREALRAGGLRPARGVATDPTDKPGNLYDFFAPGLEDADVLGPPVGISK